MISIQDLRFDYGEKGFSLFIESLQIERAEKVAIVGASGSGKTTLLDLISGIRLPNSGSVEVDDKRLNLLNENERRRFRASRIGLVFQEFELLEYLSVRDNILLPYRIQRFSKPTCSPDQLSERVLELAERVSIADKLHRKPQRLSQGEKQRVAICRALIHQPRLLLADEPTGNLDASNKNKILSLLIEQAKTEDSTLIVVTHDQNLIGQFDRIIDVSGFAR
ncbi:MAG: ABC transporter ATP-binding protein [Pirellulaceae bacterium]|nr:ABC transporter ATP-binding protein [Mariniblastus sp.]MDB4756574.1 ABC transporter ATP-binding protein [Mariniblastus sp.]MDG2468977.1 ABC transporter ATP-binding protein [Pirellulaceae bacterium]